MFGYTDSEHHETLAVVDWTGTAGTQKSELRSQRQQHLPLHRRAQKSQAVNHIQTLPVTGGCGRYSGHSDVKTT